jgi:hypothetical protein
LSGEKQETKDKKIAWGMELGVKTKIIINSWESAHHIHVPVRQFAKRLKWS